MGIAALFLAFVTAVYAVLELFFGGYGRRRKALEDAMKRGNKKLEEAYLRAHARSQHQD